MELDEEDRVGNLCADLVSLTRLEPGLVYLFRQKPAGEWVPVSELYAAAGGTDQRIDPTLMAVWLPSASGDPGSAVILFCDEELQWSLTAYYNVGRLPGGAPPDLTPAAPARPAR